jgi:hypothetical protein
MQLQYLDTLKQVGASPATKIIVPMELGGLLNGLRGWASADAGRRQPEVAAENVLAENGECPSDNGVARPLPPTVG